MATAISEECLEACNKYVRRYCENLARKTSFTDIVRGILVRILCNSDPVLVENRFKATKVNKDPTNCEQDTLYTNTLMESYQ